MPGEEQNKGINLPPYSLVIPDFKCTSHQIIMHTNKVQ